MDLTDIRKLIQTMVTHMKKEKMVSLLAYLMSMIGFQGLVDGFPKDKIRENRSLATLVSPIRHRKACRTLLLSCQ
jgi:hypothetical protein